MYSIKCVTSFQVNDKTIIEITYAQEYVVLEKLCVCVWIVTE